MKQRLLTLGVIAAVLSLSACMKEADSSAGLSDNALSARIGQSSVSNQNGDLNDGVLSLRNRESLVHSHVVDGQLVRHGRRHRVQPLGVIHHEHRRARSGPPVRQGIGDDRG
ncbi:MAG TPA: hypothetical protein P5565_11470, partial [Bacteroidia bacterium]|nr:hypothetical protein [Bacteroidia bacterium]